MSTDKPPSKDRSWRGDRFSTQEVLVQSWWLLLLALLIAPGVYSYLRNPPSANNAKVVVAYCAQDREYAEPILNEFTRQTGIQVQTVFDNEAVKTVGLANRLLAERSHPQCDVFWGNEELRTRQLAAQQVFRETNGWVAIGYRSRRVVINTNHVSLAQAPRSLRGLTNAAWHGKVALAYPLFGTTSTHFHALRQHWGRTTAISPANTPNTPARRRKIASWNFPDSRRSVGVRSAPRRARSSRSSPTPVAA